MDEAKKNEHTVALKKVKEFGFTAGMPKCALAKGRGKK